MTQNGVSSKYKHDDIVCDELWDAIGSHQYGHIRLEDFLVIQKKGNTNRGIYIDKNNISSIIKKYDYYGKKKEIKAHGLLSTCIQHEVDHLNGVLFIDYLSKLKKDMIIKKLIKQKKELNKLIL